MLLLFPRNIGSICSSSQSVLQSLVMSLVLSCLDYSNISLAGVPSYQLKRLQSMMNCAVWLYMFSCLHHITLLLHQLHWLLAQYKLAVQAYKCHHGTAPTYLCDELFQPTDLAIRSASTPVRRTWLSTVSDQTFPIAVGVSVFFCLLSRPHHLLSVFYNSLKTHLFRCSFPWLL